VEVVGLTSAANLRFTEGLGCFDRVLSYEAAHSLESDLPSIYVDFNGDAKLRRNLHAHLDSNLKYSCSVGGTHWHEIGSGKGLPGPPPVLFFAPAQLKKRLAVWGQAGLQQRTASAWMAFMQPVTDSARPWLQVIRQSGPEAVAQVYQALLEGKVRPRDGHMLML